MYLFNYYSEVCSIREWRRKNNVVYWKFGKLSQLTKPVSYGPN